MIFVVWLAAESCIVIHSYGPPPNSHFQWVINKGFRCCSHPFVCVSLSLSLFSLPRVSFATSLMDGYIMSILWQRRRWWWLCCNLSVTVEEGRRRGSEKEDDLLVI